MLNRVENIVTIKALKVLWDGTHGMSGKRWSTVPFFWEVTTQTMHIISNNVNIKAEIHTVLSNIYLRQGKPYLLEIFNLTLERLCQPCDRKFSNALKYDFNDKWLSRL